MKTLENPRKPKKNSPEPLENTPFLPKKITPNIARLQLFDLLLRKIRQPILIDPPLRRGLLKSAGGFLWVFYGSFYGFSMFFLMLSYGFSMVFRWISMFFPWFSMEFCGFLSGYTYHKKTIPRLSNSFLEVFTCIKSTSESTSRWRVLVFSMGFLWVFLWVFYGSFYGFSMFFLMISYGFSMVFRWISMFFPWFSMEFCGFLSGYTYHKKTIPRLSNSFLEVFTCIKSTSESTSRWRVLVFSMGFLWVFLWVFYGSFYGFSMFFLMLSYGFSMVFRWISMFFPWFSMEFCGFLSGYTYHKKTIPRLYNSFLEVFTCIKSTSESTSRWRVLVFSMGFLWVFLWVFYGFSMGFLWVFYGFLWYGFLMVSYGSLWVFYGFLWFPMLF